MTELACPPESLPVDETPTPKPRRRLLLLAGAVAVGVVLGALAVTVVHPVPAATPTESSIDVGFAQDLTVRQLQVAEIARVTAAQTDDPEIRAFAHDIAAISQNQVGALQGWLTLWEQPTLPLDQHMSWKDGSAVDVMPGMASSADRSTLRQSHGPAADTLFLTLLRNLDLGGLDMLDYAADHAETFAVREFATTTATQNKHRADMAAHMLAERTAATSTPHN